jgi:SAM-dependent methyltransferase
MTDIARRSCPVFFVDYEFSDASQLDLLNLGFTDLSVSILASPLGRNVKFLKCTPPHSEQKTIELAGRSFVRYMDQFFLAQPPDPIIHTALCDHIAGSYQSIIDMERNISNISNLLEIIVNEPVISDLKKICVLDFGCGTGLSAVALSRLQSVRKDRIELIGTDASPAMLERADSNGLRVMTFEEWAKIAPRSFDVVMASFVFHFGLTDDEVSRLSYQLRQHGMIVGNYHKGPQIAVQALSDRFAQNGLFSQVQNADTNNPILIFRRN